MHRWTRSLPRRVCALGLSLALALPAVASVQTDLDDVARETSTLSTLADTLGRRALPTDAQISRRDPVTRYQDYVYLHLIGQHKAAAEGFYGLVITDALPDQELHRDAEWQLAETLASIGNVVTAETRLRAIMDDAAHPFRQDAVHNLLDLYGRIGRDDAFKKLYADEIVSGRVESTPRITYTLAKAFYRQRDWPAALTHFDKVEVGSPYYSRARYFMGVIALREQRMAEAPPYFQQAADTPYTDNPTRDAHDLSLLALARLAYEGGDFPRAADYYAQISGDSAYLADILYETVWSFIKQDRYDEALKSIDLFLLAFPEHRYNGELRVAQGHLFMGCAQEPAKCPRPPLIIGGDTFDRALSSYEQIVLEYEPIRARFEALAASTDDPRTYFRQVLTLDAADSERARAVSSAPEIPTFAVAMMQSDRELGKALDVYRSLESQRRDLEASERMIAEIDEVLSRDGGVGAIGRTRLDAVGLQSGAVQQQIALLTAEARWLRELGVRGSTAAATEVAALAGAGEAARYRHELTASVDTRVAEINQRIAEQQRQVDAAEEAVGDVVLRFQPDQSPEARAATDAEMVRASELLDVERQRLRALRVELTSAQLPGPELVPTPPPAEAAALRTRLKGLRPGSQAATGQRFDELHDRLDALLARADQVFGQVEAFAKTEYGQVQDRFQTEVVAVAAQRAELDRVSAEADAVAVDLTRSGFGRMESFFAESVLKADMGIIDVYWARKVELADERQRIQTERNNLVAELERRFQLIRQKMEQ